MNAKWLLLGLLCCMNNKKYKKWAQWKPHNIILGMYLSQVKRIYDFVLIILQYHFSFHTLYSTHMTSEC